MKKTWLSFFLPDDEYKERKMLYFLAEASFILLSVLVLFFVINLIFPHWGLPVEIVIGFSIGTFILYVYGRYICSGIEYTDVSTDKEFTHEKKRIIIKSIGFILTFFISYFLVKGIPALLEKWVDLIGVALLGGLFLFLIDFISLKKSYNKNKDLLDD